ncbi:Sec14p-like phosphatidylinositol transfer family protein [Striga asiatica]|uniref:Sec14p-like phosphatidylinositol transfer family protein n=1 Tax=Striga asiatica TaxID=4170 RepID=A0A5A7QTG2_STRAF|nr:Sec14p-like phosphatidylinositol transfer family protein [Striga asiatica]
MIMEEVGEDIFYSPEKTVQEKDEKNNFEEKRRVDLLRATLEKKDPSCKELDDPALRRFLRARDLHVEKASQMVTKYLAWRRTFVPKGSISESEVPNQIAQNKMFMQGKDKQGHPIAVLFGSRHFSSKGGLEEFKRLCFIAHRMLSSMHSEHLFLTVFWLDFQAMWCLFWINCAAGTYTTFQLLRNNLDGQEKFTIIADLQGYGYCNSDVRGSVAALNILQDYYPERLGKVYNIHVPYVFMTLWKIICPFIDQNTRKKIVFVENKRLRETLLEDIDESQLPEIYGGKMPLVPIHMA